MEIVGDVELVAGKVHDRVIEGSRGFSFEPGGGAPGVVFGALDELMADWVRMDVVEAG